MDSNAIETNASNRRAALRLKPPASLKLKCQKDVTGLGSNVATTLMDISETGARLVVSQELALHQEVEVEFEAQRVRHRIRRIANVRWQLKLDDGAFCVGVEFQKRLGYMEWQNIVAAAKETAP